MGVTVRPNKFFDPSTCTYKLSGKIREQVDSLVSSEDVDEVTRSVLEDLMEQEETNKNTLSYNLVVKLHKYLQRADREYTEPFYLFVEKCRCIEPKPRDNKFLDERLKRLRLRNSQSIYNTMAASVDKVIENGIDSEISGPRNNSSADIYSIADNSYGQNGRKTTHYTTEFRKLNGSVVAVFNSFLVFICTFIFCYKALEYSMESPNIIAQVVFGLAGSTIVAFAELYFLIRVL